MAVDAVKDVNDVPPRGEKVTGDSITLSGFVSATLGDVTTLVRKATDVSAGVELLKRERATIIATSIGIILLAVLQHTGWKHLSEDAWWTVWSLYIGMVAMIRGIADPDLCLFFSTAILLLKHIITPKDAYAGFSNDSIVTIAIMMVLAAGLEVTGVLQVVSRFMLGSTKLVWLGQLRMFTIVSSASAFMNNTPLVAVMIPVVERYCRKNSLPPSKFMIPLSYAAILGGLCTIIGTSTNLIVRGLVETDYKKQIRIGFWEIGIIGVPMAVAGALYIAFLSPWLLPVRTPLISSTDIDEEVTSKLRRYVVRAKVGKDFRGTNRSVEFSGLRGLHSLFLVDIQRATGEIVAAPAPKDIILEGDILSFSGDVHSVKSIVAVPGLSAVEDSEEQNPILAAAPGRIIAEVVLSNSSPVLGLTVKAARFRTKYGAAVLAVRHLSSLVENPRISDAVLQAGDALLLETTEEFLRNYRGHPDFAVVSNTSDISTGEPALQPLKMIIASAMFITLIIVNSLDVEELSTTGLTCMFGMFLARILTTDVFRKSIPGMILLTVAGAFGIAKAMTVTGLAKQLGDDLIGGFDWLGDAGPLFAVYLTTVILTALLSNGASVTIVYPIAKSIAKSTGTNPKAFFFLIMLAASSDFSTPIGYQTNLMVAGPGGYTFLDYTKFGLPLQAVCGLIAVTISHFYWGRG